MPNFKKIDVSGLLALLIFVSAMAGLSALNGFDLAESYSDTSKTKIAETSTDISENQIFRIFIEFDAALMSFFDELKEQIV